MYPNQQDPAPSSTPPSPPQPQENPFGQPEQPAPAANPYAMPPPPQPAQFGANPVQPYQAPISMPQPTASYDQPAMGASSMHPTGARNKNMMVLVGIGILVIALLGLGAWWLLSSGNNPISSVVNNATGNSDVVNRSDGTLDLSNLIDSDESIKTQTVKGKLNQQLNLSNGMSYMVTKIQRDYTSTSRFLKAGSGKELVKVSVVVGNRAKEGNLYVSSSTFQIKNAAGGLQGSEFITKEDEADALESDDVAPGKQVSGAVIFEVDKGEAISLATEDKYQRLGSEEKATVASEVTLQ